jgi:hypothetical protein
MNNSITRGTKTQVAESDRVVCTDKISSGACIRLEASLKVQQQQGEDKITFAKSYSRVT